LGQNILASSLELLLRPGLGKAQRRRPSTCACKGGTGLLPLLKSHLPPRLSNLPGQWLQCQANGSNVCRVLRGGIFLHPLEQTLSSFIFSSNMCCGTDAGPQDPLFERERLVFYCRTTSAGTAPRTLRRTCCPYTFSRLNLMNRARPVQTAHQNCCCGQGVSKRRDGLVVLSGISVPACGYLGSQGT